MNKNKNTILIIAASAVVVLIAIIAIALGSCSKDDKGAQETTALRVVNESGNQDETIDAKIKFRDFDFSMSIKQVKAFEDGMNDTLADPTISSSEPQEGSNEPVYTYIMYRFNPEDVPTFFGTKVLADNPNACLTYVFEGKKMIEVRVQYGAVDASAYDAVVANNNSQFGNATYSREYSNSSKNSWWKTKKGTLEVIYQFSDANNTGMFAYYRAK